MESTTSNNNIQTVKRSVSIRCVCGFIWFVVLYVIYVYAMAEAISLYANSVATGAEAIELDRALSRKAGASAGVIGLVVIAILVAIFSVKGTLPGTKKFKKI